jgi:DNA-binding NtrC family response regulator
LVILAVGAGNAPWFAQIEELRHAGHAVTRTESFHAARQHLLRGDRHVDLLITGHRLGDYNGLHLVCYAKRLCRQTDAIMIDETFDVITQKETCEMGATYVAPTIHEGSPAATLLSACATLQARTLMPSPVGASARTRATRNC